MATRKNPQRNAQKRGPKPEVLKVEDDWKAAVARALARGKPPSTKKKAK